MKMLVTIDISKGFAAWKQMAKDMAPEMEKVGVKMVWGGTNPDESKVFVLVEMEDPEQMKTFGEREDVAKARAEGGEDVASTTVISPIGLWAGLVSPLYYSLFVVASRHIPVAELMLAVPLETILSVLLAWLVLAEIPSTNSLLGGIIVIAAVSGMAIYRIYQRPRTHTA